MKNDITKSEALEAVLDEPWTLPMYDENDEELQLAMVKENSFFIKYIQNPTENVQLAAIDDMRSSFVYIMKPCQKVIDMVINDSGWMSDVYVIPRNISPDLEFAFYEPVYTNMEQIMYHLECYINEKVRFFKYKKLESAMNFLSGKSKWCFENGSRACYIDIRKVDLSNIDDWMLNVLNERPDRMGVPNKEFVHGADIDSNFLLPMACGVEYCPDGHADYLVFEYKDELYIITILCYE